MGRIRGWVKRIEHAARGNLPSFELLDGSRYYDPTSGELFLHWYECLKAGNPDQWPPAPEVCKKLTEAKDPAAAGDQLVSNSGNFFCYDSEVLVTERRLEPRLWLYGIPGVECESAGLGVYLEDNHGVLGGPWLYLRVGE